MSRDFGHNPAEEEAAAKMDRAKDRAKDSLNTLREYVRVNMPLGQGRQDFQMTSGDKVSIYVPQPDKIMISSYNPKEEIAYRFTVGPDGAITEAIIRDYTADKIEDRGEMKSIERPWDQDSARSLMIAVAEAVEIKVLNASKEADSRPAELLTPSP